MWHDAIQTPGPIATLPAPDGSTGYASAGTDGQRPSEPAVAEGVVGMILKSPNHYLQPGECSPELCITTQYPLPAPLVTADMLDAVHVS